MFYAIIALVLFSIVLLVMDYRNRYCWLFTMMVTGMVIAFFSTMIYLTKFGNYYYIFNKLFILDYSIFSYVGRTIKLPLSTTGRIMNLGIALYMLAVPLFVYEFAKNRVHNIILKNNNITKFIIMISLIIYNLCFYDPSNAYGIYVKYNLQSQSTVYANFINVLHRFNQIWVLAYLFYPVYILYKYMTKNTIRFVKKQIFLLAVCLCVMDLLFYSVFFIGPFMMSPDKAFVSGFWIFENVQVESYRYYLFIPLMTVCVLLFTLLLLLKYRLGSLINLFVDRKVQRNITKMNDGLSDTLHSQKNLLFSISILARQASQNKNDPNAVRDAINNIMELSETSLKRTSDMLDSLREIRYKFKNNDLLEVIDEAIHKISLPSNVNIVWNKDNHDHELLNCRFDYYHMSRVFINIFNNAVEAIEIAKREQGFIHVDISFHFQWIIIVIQDNGNGIKKSSFKKLFNPYYSDKAGSTNWGLGLSYANKVVKAHLGQMHIESTYGETTSVQIILPIYSK